MSIKVISSKDAIVRTAKSLGVFISDGEPNAVQFISQALRRSVMVLSPCADHELERAVNQSLSKITEIPAEELSSRIHLALEDLLIYGEIFEMKALDDDVWHTAPLVLRPAPPSFVRRYDGSIVILGVAGDDINPLTTDLSEQIFYHGVLRILPASKEEDVSTLLEAIGLIELSEKSWLRLPPAESSNLFLQHYRDLLCDAPKTGPVEGLRILDTSSSTQFYKDRWIDPRPHLDGIYIARRPQRYGTALWCLVQVNSGMPERFIDLISPADRERPCDLAWRIQMALDFEHGILQKFNIQLSESNYRFDFHSPLPSWAERALAVVGKKVEPVKCLISYNVPDQLAPDKIRMLKELLWMEETQS